MVPTTIVAFSRIRLWGKCLTMISWIGLQIANHLHIMKKFFHFLLGDEIFPLKKWLMRPYPGKNGSEEERICNYWHSRARQCIKNAFGILSASCRVFQKPVRATMENVERYSLACLVLHNYLQPTDNAHYTPSIFVDSEDKNGNLVPGEWMLLKGNYSNNNGLVSLPHVGGSRSRQDALEARCELKTFLYSDEGSLSSQTEYVWPTSLCFVVSTLFLITFNNKEKTQQTFFRLNLIIK